MPPQIAQDILCFGAMLIRLSGRFGKQQTVNCRGVTAGWVVV